MTLQPLEIQKSDRGKNLYIFFGGIAAGIAMPPFEFYKTSKILDEHRVFIRDLSQSWYQRGLTGISTEVNGTADYIAGLIGELQPQKTFFVGNSMGGYAAILFSSLLGGEAIAFAPQSFISPLLRIRYKDFRWQRQVISTYFYSVRRDHIWDLKPLLERNKRNRVSIYVCPSHHLDSVHASRLSGIGGVRIFEIPGGGHDLVKVLRDSGRLPSIMAGQIS